LRLANPPIFAFEAQQSSSDAEGRPHRFNVGHLHPGHGMNAAESVARRSALFSLVSQTAPAHSRDNRTVLTLHLGLPFSEARDLARQMCCLTIKAVRAPDGMSAE
jgi:hypothetical protein